MNNKMIKELILNRKELNFKYCDQIINLLEEIMTDEFRKHLKNIKWNDYELMDLHQKNEDLIGELYVLKSNIDLYMPYIEKVNDHHFIESMLVSLFPVFGENSLDDGPLLQYQLSDAFGEIYDYSNTIHLSLLAERLSDYKTTIKNLHAAIESLVEHYTWCLNTIIKEHASDDIIIELFRKNFFKFKIDCLADMYQYELEEVALEEHEKKRSKMA